MTVLSGPKANPNHDYLYDPNLILIPKPITNHIPNALPTGMDR